MISDEDDIPTPYSGRFGEDLAAMSEEELTKRIALLESEIARTETALEAKRASRDTAASFFKA